MFNSKQRVDKHVSNILGRMKDTQEKYAKGYQIAKMYFDIKEYESARKYLLLYLGFKEASPIAHTLMGQILEAQDNKEGALTSYLRSHQLNDKQKDVVIKICEIYSRTDVDPERARFWVEKAQKMDPNHKVVAKLRERIYTSSETENSSKDLEALITAELVKRPHDISLRIRLLRHYISLERTNEAYDHVVQIERRRPYQYNLEWYQTVVEVLDAYHDESNARVNSAYHHQMLLALAAITVLSLQQKSVASSAEALMNFDIGLQHAGLQRSSPSDWPHFLVEMRAEYWFLAGTLLLKRALAERRDWTQSARQAAAFFLACYAVCQPDTQAAWFAAASADEQLMFQRWCDAATHRLSQTGHILMNMIDENGSNWLTSVKNELCTQQGCQMLLDRLYPQHVKKCARNSSFLVQNQNTFVDFSLRMPNKDQLRVYDEVAHRLRPDSLNHIVWIAMQYHQPNDARPGFKSSTFDHLQLSTKTLNSSAPESLCQLDVEAFLYATVHNTVALRTQKQKVMRKDSVQYDQLPVTLCDNLCSDAQAKWWEAAYKLYMNTAKDNLSRLRLTLIHGLEVLRVFDNHGMDVKLVVQLARMFANQESELVSATAGPLESSPEAEPYRARAHLYWTRVLTMMNRAGRKLSKDALFPAVGDDELTPAEVRDAKREGNFYLAYNLLKSGKYEEAIEAFDQLDMPQASYYQAKMFVQLGEGQFGNQSLSSLSDDQRSQYLALLDRAKEAYYTTLDRIRTDKHHILHRMLPDDIAQVENEMASINGGNEDEQAIYLGNAGNNNNTSRASNVPERSVGPLSCSTPYRPASKSLMNDITLNGTSSPEMPRHRTSPERLEAQIRCLQLTQDKVVNSVQDSIKELVNTNRIMQSEMRDFKTALELVRMKIEELSVRQPVPPPPVPYPAYPPVHPHMPHHMPPNMPPNMHPHAFYPEYMNCPVPFMPPQYANPAISSLHNLAQVSAPHQSSESRPPASQGFETEFDEEEYFHDDDFLDENYCRDKYKDSDLIQETWPYGHITDVKGNNTVTYAPQTTLPMPGPGFFSRSEPANSARSLTQGIGQKPGILGSGPQPSFKFGLRTDITKTTPQLSSAASSLSSYDATKSEKPDEKNQNESLDNQESSNGNENDDSYDPDFKPIMKLPDKVEVVTGEENEHILYESPRAKLYRFVDGQWKERGTGPVKLLQNKETKRVRFIMRREHVFKICANHYLDKNMNLTQNEQNKTALLWFADDFADGEIRNEKFCLRFKTDELMMAFKKAFNYALSIVGDEKAKLGESEVVVLPNLSPSDTKKVLEPARSTEKEFCKLPLSTPNKQTSSKSEPTVSPFAGFSFGLKAGPGPTKSFTMKSEPSPSKTDGSATIFGKPVLSETDTVKYGNIQTEQSKLAVAQQTKQFFGQIDNIKPKFGHGETQKPVFGQFSPMDSFASLATKGDSKIKLAAPSAFPGTGRSLFASESPGGNGDDPHDYEAHVDFQPLIQLPDLVKVETGEEEEEKLFGERATLYRHDSDSKAWKERGVGEIKLQRNTKTGRCRVIMRREQVLKVCANHNISEHMKLIKMGKSTKAWCWFAQDFSDPDAPTTEQFAVKFKHEDHAAAFKQAFEECQNAPVHKSDTTISDVAQKDGKISTQAIAEKFKIKEGEWDCATCYTRNKSGSVSCLACQVVRPTSKADNAVSTSVAQNLSTISDAQTSAIVDKFKLKLDEWECDGCFTRNKMAAVQCVCCQARNPNAPDPLKGAAGQLQFGTIAAGGGLKFGIATGNLAAGFGSRNTNIGSLPGSESDKNAASLFSSPSTGFSTSVPVPNGGGTFAFGKGLDPTKTGGFLFGQKDSSKPASVGTTSAPGSGSNVLPTSGFVFGKQSTGEKPVESEQSKVSPIMFDLGAASSSFKFGSSSQTEKDDYIKQETPDKTSTFKFAGLNDLSKFCSGFNFSTPVTSNPAQKFSTSTPADSPHVSKPHTTSSLVSSSMPTGFKFGDQTTFSFAGVTPAKQSDGGVKSPLQVRSPLSPKSPDDHYAQEEDDSHIFFEPIIPLPDKVDVKSGEEDELEKFSHRAKLYRFVKGEWKERGLGNVKILEHKVTKKVRVVMRREQVLKLCLNHLINSSMVLKPMKGARGAAWVWSAMDFSEGEEQFEQFCIKFKTVEIANDFKAAFEGCPSAGVRDLTNDSSSSVENFSFKLDDTVISDTKLPDNFTFQSPNSSVTSNSSFTFGDRFKRESTATTSFGGGTIPSVVAGVSVDDDDCVITHVVTPSAADVEKARRWQLPDNFYNYMTMPDCPGCAGCTDAMPEHEPSDERIGSSPSGARLKLPAKYYRSSDKGPQGDANLDEAKVSESKDATNLTANAEFGAVAAIHTPVSPKSKSAFSQKENPFSSPSLVDLPTFADLCGGTAPMEGIKKQDGDKPFLWQGAGQTLFGDSSLSSTKDGAANDESLVATDDPHYEPIIDLPELVKTATGEENETIVWSQRCKLYRFDASTKSWKERAIGDIKILKHAVSERYRLVMRREQVHKLALNHVISIDMDLKAMSTSETAWCWFAQDYAEPTPSGAVYEQFAVRFKNRELAQEYYDTFVDCQRRLAATAAEPDVVHETTAQDAVAPPSQDTDAVTVADVRVDADPAPQYSAPGTEGAEENVQGDEMSPDDEEYEEDDVEEPIFEKRITLHKSVDKGPVQKIGLGQLTIVDADYAYGRKVNVTTDDGTLVCDHYITIETKINVNKEKKTATWNSLDFSSGQSRPTMFTADFSSTDALNEYEQFFLESIKTAQDLAISEHDLVMEMQEIDRPEAVGRIYEGDDDGSVE